MKVEDFQYAWRGKFIRDLREDESHLLSAIDIQRNNQGKALLLLHGFSSSPAIYRELIPHFTMYDKLLGPILPGHAESIESFASVKANDWFKASLKAYQELLKNYDTVDIMGLSLGGVLACKLAEEHKPNHLYLLSPALELHGFIDVFLLCAKILYFLGFKQIRNKSGNLYTNKHQEITYKQLPMTAIIEILSFIKKTKCKKLDCKTDLFLGLYDKIVNSKKVEKLFIDNLNITIHWLNKSAHVLPLEDLDLNQIIQCVEANNC